MPDTTALDQDLERRQRQLEQLDRLAQRFGTSLSTAFAKNAADGRRLDDVLNSVGRTLLNASLRAAMKPLPTLMKPLDSVDLATGEPAQALVERSDVAAVEALAVVAEAVVAWELARAAREKLGGDAMVDVRAAHRAYLERIRTR